MPGQDVTVPPQRDGEIDRCPGPGREEEVMEMPSGRTPGLVEGWFHQGMEVDSMQQESLFPYLHT